MRTEHEGTTWRPGLAGTPVTSGGHLLLLGLALAAMAAMTWRCWPDPVVDFGRELYSAWRLSHGEVLYRDVDGFYGPLSQYVNAGLFRLFGPGLMVLAWANLVILAAIVGLLYALLRRGWKPWVACGATLVFVLIFGFSRFSTTGSFNFVAPYAHEVTHGWLLLLLLVHVLWRWRYTPRFWQPGVGGLLLGCTLLLKPEILLAALALTVMAGVERWFALSRVAESDGADARGKPVKNPRGRDGLFPWFSWGIGVILPTLAFALFFRLQGESWSEAFGAAGRAWLNVVARGDYISDPAQLNYLGVDDPRSRLGIQVSATMAALGLIACIAVAAIIVRWIRSRWARIAWLLGTVVLSGAWGWHWEVHGWIEVGRCLLGLLLLYWTGHTVAAFFRPSLAESSGRWMRLALATVALALFARMVLNGRIYQFGFYQSALAAVVLTAALLEEVPAWFHPDRWAVATARGGLLALLVVGTGLLVDQNRRTHRLITLPLGEGADRFFVLSGEVLTTNPLLVGVAAQMMAQPRGQTLVCLPEGLMINYLARMRSPLPHFFYYSVVTERGREAKVVARLQQRSPDWVVMIPRDLREYGISSYGERAGAGAELRAWVESHYDSVGQLAGEPLSYERHQVQVFRRRP